MKIACACGAWIFDASDNLPHKAHLIADQDWFALWDALDAEVVDRLVAGKINQEGAYQQMRSLINRAARTVYQCAACGRVYMLDTTGQLQCYCPETAETKKQVLRTK